MKNFVLFCLIAVLFYSCDNSDDALIDQSIFSKQQIEDSEEFTTYKNDYIDLVRQMQGVIDETSDADAQKVIELYKLYISEPDKYKDLLEFQIKNIVGKDSILFIKKVEDVIVEKRRMIDHLNLKKVNDLQRTSLSKELMDNAYQYQTKGISISRVKTRSETSECEDNCARDRDDDINFAQDLAMCGTAVNTLTCLATAGGSSLIWWVTEFGIAYVHDRTVAKAWEDYEKCIKRCK